MGDNLKVRDDLGPCPLRYRIYVNNVILVCMGDQDIVGLQNLDVNVFSQRIRTDKGIYN